MKRRGDNYDDKFNEVMTYVDLRLKSSGTRLRVRDKEDLRTLFQRLDEQRKDKRKTSPRFTNDFIERAITSNAAKKRYGTVVGRFGTIKTLRREENAKMSAKQQGLRSQGRAIYGYNGGKAYKSSYRRGSKTVTNFRDLKTGRFLKRSTHFTEE